MSQPKIYIAITHLIIFQTRKCTGYRLPKHQRDKRLIFKKDQISKKTNFRYVMLVKAKQPLVEYIRLGRLGRLGKFVG